MANSAPRGRAAAPTPLSRPTGRAARPAGVPGRRAAATVAHTEHIAVRIPGLGQRQLPSPEQLAYYAALGALVAFEILEWPAAVVLAAGHALTSQQHNRAFQEFGDALEEA